MAEHASGVQNHRGRFNVSGVAGDDASEEGGFEWADGAEVQSSTSDAADATPPATTDGGTGAPDR